MIFKDFFQKKVKINSSISFDSEELGGVIAQNRKSLSEIETWQNDAAMIGSCFEYGVPSFIRVELDKKLNNDPTYSDYILLVARKYFENLNYLEIGVSVGKNFFQILNGVKNSNLVGFDIEDIYPVLQKKLDFKSDSFWPSLSNSIKKNNSSLKEYSYNSNKVKYISADVWDENSWKRLSGEKFNIIFSDALHTPEAILFEFEMLVKYKLLADKFVIVWDDLVGDMQKSFYQIIKKYDKEYNIKSKFLIKVNGWVGQYEDKHSVGIISNFEISSQ